VSDLPVSSRAGGGGSPALESYGGGPSSAGRAQPARRALPVQLVRFGVTGVLNTLIDILVLNALVWLLSVQRTPLLLACNVVAYSTGALNSFILNKYWTFGRREPTSRRELLCFALVTVGGSAWSTLMLWLAGRALQHLQLTQTLWTTTSKVVAIAATALLSYLGLRLWVFVRRPPAAAVATLHSASARCSNSAGAESRLAAAGRLRTLHERKRFAMMATPAPTPAPLPATDRAEVELPGSRLPGCLLTSEWPPRWRRLALALVGLLSIFMNFYQLGQNGFGNLYYAATVRSMLDNWHNFFFAAFDPGAFVTVDKPPLGFWLQVLSARILGLTPFSVLLPQALAGVLSVLLLFHLVRRHVGTLAGLLAALALALSPISVLTNRNNTIDSTLVLTMLLGAWAVMRAAETGRLRWLLLCALSVGLGFNIKMLEAYLVVPAYGLLYLLAAPRALRVRLLHLVLATVLMLAVSFSWALAVDLTPASARPYVGSSQDNSEISLALGYNGIERLLGQFGVGPRTRTNVSSPSAGGNTGGTPDFQPGSRGTGAPPGGDFQPGGGPSFGNGSGAGNGPGAGGGGGGMFNTGTPGPLRLFTEPLGGQIVWLLPMALLGMLAVAWQRRPRPREDREQQALILWGTWLLTTAVFFSAAGFFHQYYLSTMAPAVAALFGIGVVIMWRDYRRGGWRGWLLPLALLATALEQIFIILSNPAWGTWLIPCIAVPSALAALVLLTVHQIPALREQARLWRLLVPVVALALVALQLTPAVWTAIPVLNGEASSLPVAGPGGSQFDGGLTGLGLSGRNGAAPNAGNASASGSGESALIRYLQAHRHGARYLVAVTSSNEADSIILATNQPVMTLGGFSGSDPILTVDQLAALVKSGAVRYFLLGGNGGGPGGGQSSLIAWITAHSTVVPSSAWQTPSSTATTGTPGGLNGFGGSMQLYEYTGNA
jgi:4-amino-4-deoxy-L-arabinose transferase-like glycosyltransferase/putative flippase GtrA